MYHHCKRLSVWINYPLFLLNYELNQRRTSVHNKLLCSRYNVCLSYRCYGSVCMRDEIALWWCVSFLLHYMHVSFIQSRFLFLYLRLSRVIHECGCMGRCHHCSLIAVKTTTTTNTTTTINSMLLFSTAVVWCASCDVCSCTHTHTHTHCRPVDGTSMNEECAAIDAVGSMSPL